MDKIAKAKHRRSIGVGKAYVRRRECSQLGNKLFPAWETNVPSVGINSSTKAHFLRSLMLLLLMMMVAGITVAWGQPSEGLYFIANYNNNGYNAETPANNFYLVPATNPQKAHGIDAYYADDFGNEDGDPDQPFLTTYKTNKDENSVWRIEKVPGETGSYYIIHQQTGRYVIYEPVFSGNNSRRKCMHLKTTNTPPDEAKFEITVSLTGYAIRPKSVASGNCYFNVASANTNKYYSDGPTSGTAGTYFNGLVGLYTDPKDKNGVWCFEKATIDPPTITNNETATNTFTIAAETGATIYYTTDGTTPTTSDYTGTGTTSVNVDQTGSMTVIKAIAKATSDHFPTIVTTYNIPACERPAIKVSGGTVTITCPKAGADIYFTTNGDPATSSSTPYAGPFAKGDATTIRAIATKAGYIISSEAVFLPPTEVSSSSEMTDMNGNYLLTSSFTSSGSIGTSANPFKGTIDGNLNPLTLSYPLVAYADGAIIKNVILDNDNVTIGDNENGNAGAICCEATGDTRIYNCGVLGGSVEGSNNVGGIVGLLDGRARVVNCYNYAKITSGSNCGGIVGYNNVASTSGNLQTMVMNCMFYGNITGGNAAPIYGGKNIHNKYASEDNTGLNNYCYFLYDEEKVPYVTSIAGANYHGALGAEERFLNRFEFFRMTLNSTRSLAAYYATGDATQKGEMAKWVLDKSIAPYPILKAQGKYPSIVNPDAEHATPQTERNKGGLLGTLSVTIQMGSGGPVFSAPTGASITTGNLTLNVTDKDYDNFNYNYKKVQLPYYNEVGEGNYTGGRVVTGWKITSITGGTSGSFTTNTYDYPSFNFVDRKCTNKDLFSESGRVFAQGAYWEVPDGVTAITIEPYWAKAVYLSDANYDVTYSMTFSGSGSSLKATTYKYGVTVCGSSPTDYNGQTVYTDLSPALTNLGSNASHKVYDYAVVLVGNYHQAANDALVNNGLPVTFMSADLDGDNEPDNTLFYYHNMRKSVSPVRFDFLNIPGIGMVKRTHDATMDPEPGIFCPKGWFEVTNTVFIRFGQFEYAGSSSSGTSSKPEWTKTSLEPLILQGGIYEQFVSCCRTNAQNTNYLLIGGNAWFKNFANGCHTAYANKTPKVPINVAGGDYTNFYLTGIYQPTSNEDTGDAECYIDGGRFTEVAGAGMQQVKGNVTWLINAADITSFYGGGINAAQAITGSISTTISNSYVDEFYGGPKFGDMSADKTVTTDATDCHFDKFFGAGYGGTAFNKVLPTPTTTYDNSSSANTRSWNSWVDAEYKREYNATNGGISTDYDYEFILHSDGNQTVARFYVNYASLSLATTRNVTSTLSGCTVGTFYGGGSLGAVNGDVNSTLTNCTVTGNAFGAGFSASVPTVEVWNKGAYLTPNPTYNRTANVFNNASVKTPKDNGQYVVYTWSKTHGSNDNPFVDTEDGKHYIHTDVSLDGLGTVTGKVTLNINGTTVGESVYGGGEESAVDGNTFVTVNSGEIGGKNTGKFGYRWGNVYGGGKGKIDDEKAELTVSSIDDLDAGLVKGNTNIKINGGTILHNVYGGGAVGSVGTFTRDNTTGMPTACAANTGLATVTINGGTIGHGHQDTGMVNGSSRGWEGNPNGTGAFAFLNQLAWVNNTNVIIGSETSDAEDKGPVIMGSVYGGGENGHNFGNGVVTLNKGTIGNKDATWDSGNIYGAGCGTDTYKIDEDPTEHHNPMAGLVRGTTSITVNGGQVLRNIYGGGAMGSVGGSTTVANAGKTTINIYGGTLGTDNSEYGNVYGGPKGNLAETEFSASVRETSVNINAHPTDATKNPVIWGSVFGGGEAGIVRGAVVVNMNGGNVKQDVYGGGALANTNTDNWNPAGGTGGTGDWANATKSALYTTTVRLTGGTVGNAYGGGLGEAGTEQNPTGKPAYVWGDVTVTVNGTAFTIANDSYIEDSKTIYVPKTGRVFGCNNINGSPKGEVTVLVKKTVAGNVTRTAGTDLDDPAETKHTYEIAAVYGGGNEAPYEPVKVETESTTDENFDDDDTKASTNVIIEGCANTSIETVYGGGNAASTPSTKVTIQGAYEIGEVFGGGNGKDKIKHGDSWDDNEGAHVGFRAYAKTATPEQKAAAKYGSGQARVNIYGGKIHAVYGGSNTLGNVRRVAVAMLAEQSTESCVIAVDEAYGGGKSADMDGKAILNLGCIPGLTNVYGGARAATVNNDVVLNITNGTYQNVFGGNNESGRINGSITVNVEETGCRPIHITNLYGGGNQAAYPGTGAIVADANKKVTVNVKSCTSIGNVFGGGLGNTAIVTGTTEVNINQVKGKFSKTSTGYTQNTYGDDEVEGLGTIGNVYGGGSEGKVIGNTNVNIGTEPTVTYVTGTETTTSKDVMGVNITGSVYGGGLSANVEGNSTVMIGTVALTADGAIGVNIAKDVFGGGEGQTTNVSGNVTVEIGTDNGDGTFTGAANIGTATYAGSIYGGSAYGSVNTQAIPASGNDPEVPASGEVTVKLHKGNVKGAVYGGGMGKEPTSATATDGIEAKVFGNSEVTLYGDVVTGGLFGGCNLNGRMFGTATLNLYGGTVGTAYSGENPTIPNMVFGGGYGALTTVDGKITLNVGTETTPGNCTIYGNVYGGSMSGSTNAIDVNLYGGTIWGNVFGGGYSTATGKTAATDVLVTLNGTKFNCTYEGTGQIFGCNNLQGSPTGNVKVHVKKTVNVDDDEDAKKNVDTTPLANRTTYDVAAIYGGGNQADYVPAKALSTVQADKEQAYTEVLIEGCDKTSIGNVYGGGNAAAVPATLVTVNGSYIINRLYGGGNGAGEGNPGANVGSYDYRSGGAAKPYGTGKAVTKLNGGTIGAVFGGSNTKGDISGGTDVKTKKEGETLPTDCCTELVIGELYGAGSHADVAGDVNILLECLPDDYVGAVYGGAEQASIDGDVTLTVTSGKFGRVFGGNNEGGNIKGSITVNVVEGGCKPLEIGELFGGGNQAPYSMFGCEKNASGIWVAKTEGTSNLKAGKKYAIEVNVIACTSIGKVFGGGYGPTAVVIGDTHVDVNMVRGYVEDQEQKTIGRIGQVFGGGSAANVTGSTTIDVGTITSNEDTGVNIINGNYLSATQDEYISIAKAGIFGGGEAADVFGNTMLNIGSVDQAFGVNITGDIFGGGKGHTTKVTGNVEVNIGKKTGTGSNATYTGFAKITGNVYGGSAMGTVNAYDNSGVLTLSEGKTTKVNLYGGAITGSVFGGGYGKNDETEDLYNANVYGPVTVTVEGGKASNVYGCNNLSGEPQSTVNVNINNTEEEKDANNKFIDAIGNVFGGGNRADYTKGTPVILMAGGHVNSIFGGGDNADVAKNTSVTMTGGVVRNRLYGGGNLGSVGTYTKDSNGKPETWTANTGKCTVVVSGGEVGQAGMRMPDDYGYVFGAGRGKVEDPAINADINNIAYVDYTDVTISGSALVFGGVYGGSENGRVRHDTDVKIQGGQIGAGYNMNRAYTVDEWAGKDPTVLKECASWDYGKATTEANKYAPYDPHAGEDGYDAYGGSSVGDDGHTFYGNVFGGGSGYFAYLKKGTTNQYEWLPSAGLVEGDTHVTISGGHILTGVYGGNELTDVKGTCYIEMTGGTIGVPRSLGEIALHSVTCNLFGAGKGDQRAHFADMTNVGSVDVKISGGTIYGSVFGGGEDGHVLGDVKMVISEEDKTNYPTMIGTYGTSYMDGNVFGGGRGFAGETLTAGAVRGNVDMEIKGGNILGSVFGGGRLGSVGSYLVPSTHENYGKLMPDNGNEKHGYVTIDISGGIIGNNYEYVHVPDAGDDYVDTEDKLKTWKNEHMNPETEYALYNTAYRLKHTKGGNVFAGGMGRFKKLDGTVIARWADLGKVKSTKLTISGGTIKSAVYGGGEMGKVEGSTEVIVETGTTEPTIGSEIKDNDNITKYSFGSVFGGGYGSDVETLTDGKETEDDTPKLDAGIVMTDTKVTIEAGIVKGSVFGGGEMASVKGDTHVSVSGGIIGINKNDNGERTVYYGGATMGNVYGGGSGLRSIVRAGHVWGNTKVDISGSPIIYHNVYGGGAYGTVGDFEYDYVYDAPGFVGTKKVSALKKLNSGGKAEVIITGGTIGIDGNENGMVFGSSRGDVDEPRKRDDLLAWVNDTYVTIGDGTNGPQIKGSVYGSGENGHTFNNTNVTINSGTVGIPDGLALPLVSGGEPLAGADYPYRGNVYGGGCGTDTYTKDGKKYYNPWAGLVKGNATITMNGGHVVRNVYGAGAMGSVGTITNVADTADVAKAKHADIEMVDGKETIYGFGLSWPYKFVFDENTGLTTININGGTIGVAGKTGDVYGAARGEAGDRYLMAHFANVRETKVTVKDATIHGSVYGGAENGHVNENASVTIESGSQIARSVFGGGKGMGKYTVKLKDPNHPDNTYSADIYSMTAGRVYGNTNVTMTGGQVGYNVYGGGDMGSVGKGNYSGGADDYSTAGYGETLKGNLWDNVSEDSKAFLSSGVTNVTITGGTIGQATVNDGDLPTGNVFGGCRGEASPNVNSTLSPRYHYFPVFYAGYVNESKVNIGSSTGVPTILGSVYGGGQDGHVRRGTHVVINNGIIGTESNASDAYWKHRGNVYGSGSGLGKYVQETSSYHSSSSGSVTHNTIVDVKGGTIHQTVYGGGALSSVGPPKITQTEDAASTQSLCQVNVMGGVIEGDVNGASRGDLSLNLDKEKFTTCLWSEVNIKPGATVKGNVFGGGEAGLLKHDAVVNVTGGEMEQDVYGGGDMADVNGNTSVYLKGGIITGAAYGGGRGRESVAAAVGGNTLVDLNDGVTTGCVVDRIFGCNNVNGTPKGHVKVHVHATQNAGKGTVSDKPDTGFDMTAVFGGGNKADYVPNDMQDYAEVIIEGCDLTSINEVYGGGFGASTPATMVRIKGTKLIENVFGGGYGEGEDNPGANVGYRTDPKNAYGTGKATVELMAGKVNYVYGGSNSKGDIRGGSSLTNVPTEWTEGSSVCCQNLDVQQLYGGGKNALQQGGTEIVLGCMPNDWIEEIYAGAQNADVGGNVNLTITSGKFRRVFGGNKAGGKLQGSITVNIEENPECGTPIIIGELYGGGNLAPYSIYGYNTDGSVKTSGTQIYGNPNVNVRAFTSIGNIFGGGYGEAAEMVGNPEIHIDEVEGGKTYAGEQITLKDINNNESTVTLHPRFATAKMGVVGTVFGGGNAAKVIGSTRVYVATEEEVNMHVLDNQGNAVLDTEGKPTYTKKAVIGADIRGNVYGGGNQAEVTGQTNVQIGNRKTSPSSTPPAPEPEP